MLRTLGLIAALQFLAWTPTWACTGQIGAVIFQDNFADANGGWDNSPPEVMVVPPSYVFALDGKVFSTSSQNLTFNATDGDYCADVLLPPSISPDNTFNASLRFWGTPDYQNTFEVTLASDHALYIRKEIAGNFFNVSTFKNAPGFNAGANAVNSLRVTALAGIIMVYLNGTQVGSVRAQDPTPASLNFGMAASIVTPVANMPPVKFKNFIVTTGK